MADEDERPEEETVPFTKTTKSGNSLEGPTEVSEVGKDANVKTSGQGTANQARVDQGNNKYQAESVYKPKDQTATATSEDLYQNTGADNGKTTPGSPPKNNETIRIVNGVYMHRHPGYPAGATSLSQQRWHPAKQRHRSESGRDITEKLHEAAGLGPDGLHGAPPMTFADAWQGTKASMKRNSGMILGSMALAGISAAPKVVDSLFNMAEAIMSGNPMSMASTIASSTIDTFSSIPQEMARLREKYNIPEGVPEETLLSTLVGGLYKKEANAYDEAYTRESKSSNAILEAAVDSGVIVDPTANTTLDQMYRGTLINSDPVKDWDAYRAEVERAKADFLGKHTAFDWDGARKKAMTQMSDTQLRMMAEGLKRRDDDFTRAMNDLVTEGKAYTLTDNGTRVNFGAPIAVSSMSRDELDKYKIALQIGSKMTVGQMQRVSDRTKELARDNRALQAKIREDTRKHKQIQEERRNENMRRNVLDPEYGMAFNAMYRMGKDVSLTSGYMPASAETRGSVLGKLQELIAMQEKNNADADAAGVFDPKERKLRFNAYDKVSIENAERIYSEWNKWHEGNRMRNAEAKKEAIEANLYDMDVTDRLLYKFKDKDANGLPEHLYGDNGYHSKITEELSGWDSNPDKGNIDDTLMDTTIRRYMKAAGISDIDKAMNALKNVSSNRDIYERLRDLTRSEAGMSHNSHSYTMLHNHEMATMATSRFHSLENLVKKYNMDNKNRSNDPQFQACMRNLQAQKNGLVRACMSYGKDDPKTGWTGEMYDQERYDQFMENCQLLFDAVTYNTEVPDSFKNLGSDYFEKRIDDKARNDIFKELAEREANPEFYGGRSLSRLFNSITSANPGVVLNNRILNRSINEMGGFEGETLDRLNPSTQYLGALKMVTGKDPFSISTKNMGRKGMSDLLESIKAQKAIYDGYVSRLGPGADLRNDALALTMESYMDYSAKKLAIATLRNSGKLNLLETDSLDEYEEFLDDDTPGRLINLSYDEDAKSFTNEMHRMSQADVNRSMATINGLLDNTTYENSLQTHMAQVRDTTIRRAGLNSTLTNVAKAVGDVASDRDMSTFFAAGSHGKTKNANSAGMTVEDMADFFGINGPGVKQNRKSIKDAYGFNYSNAMDQMAVMALKEAGVKTFSSLKSRTQEDLDQTIRRLNRMSDNIQRDENLTLGSKLAAQKAYTSAINAVSCFKGYAKARDLIDKQGQTWLTADGKKMVQPLMQDMDDNFNIVFKQAKENLWTSNLGNTFESITPLDGKNIDAVAATSILCSAAGVDPSLGQGTINDKKASRMKESMAKKFLDKSTNRVSLENFVSADRAFLNDEVVAFTGSGGLSAYGLGKVSRMSREAVLNQVTMPMGMYALISNLIGKKDKAKGSADALLLSEDADSQMNPVNWNNNYKGLNAKDVTLVAVKTGDSDEPYKKFYAPIVERGGKYHIIRTWAKGDVDENKLKGLYGGKIEGFLPDANGTAVDKELPLGKLKAIKHSASDDGGRWSDESIAKGEDEGLYLQNATRTLYDDYMVDIAGGRVINNILYPYGIKGDKVICLVNRTKDAVMVNTGGKDITYISRRFGEIRCGEYSQTLGGVEVDVTLPWEDIKISPPCPFYGLLDVYVPWAKDGFKDPRVVEEAKKTVCTFVEAAEAAAMIRDFGGYDDTPTIEADPVARSIRNVLMRAYVKVGAYSMSVFDALHAKSDSLPKVTLNSYRDVLRSAYFLAREIGIGPCDSHGAWHLIKGIRSNIILAIDANPFMQYRKAYASSRPEVDAIAYIGTGPDAARKEQDVKDLFMLIGAMAACERPPLPAFVPGFYDDSKSEWEDAVDYWYVLLHHPDAPEPEPEPEAEPTDEEDEESRMGEESS